MTSMDDMAARGQVMLQPRDLRLIDPSFPASKDTALLVRQFCIIVNVRPVKAILMPKKVWVFPEQGADGDLLR